MAAAAVMVAGSGGGSDSGSPGTDARMRQGQQ